MNKTIEIEKAILAEFDDACENIVPEFSVMRDASNVFDREVHFDDGKMMSIQVITCRDDTCYTQGVLYEDGHEIDCTDVQDSLTGKFTVGDYSVTVEEQRLQDKSVENKNYDELQRDLEELLDARDNENNPEMLIHIDRNIDEVRELIEDYDLSDDDLFRCDNCGTVDDIEDSAQIAGKLVCASGCPAEARP